MSFLCHPTYILLGIERCLKLGPESKEDLQTEMERVAYTDRALSDNIFSLFLHLSLPGWPVIVACSYMGRSMSMNHPRSRPFFLSANDSS
jgi:hypothetical protein